jgi:arsenite oxidase small subunit
MAMTTRDKITPQPAHLCVARRQFLILGGASVATVAMPGIRDARGQEAALVRSRYPRRVVGRLSALEEGVPVEFTYPTEDVFNYLFRLGERAGGGIGEGETVVAFNQQCPHQGAPIDASLYQAAHSVFGPCPLHLSTFDLTKFGMICSGHSTSSLPQITLEADGDDIVATGVQGLFYGYAQNPSGDA